MWWTDGLRSDDGRVGAAAVCKHSDGWKAFCSHLHTGRVEVNDSELWAIGLALWAVFSTVPSDGRGR
jgi:hypothetical protein